MRERRLSLNMTQEQLAKALGVSFQQIQNYENGVNGVSAARLFDLMIDRTCIAVQRWSACLLPQRMSVVTFFSETATCGTLLHICVG